MNILIKRNMKLALTAVLIGVSVIPAYAGGGKGKGGKKALEALTSKSPVTGTTPAVRIPVTPRVPPTTSLNLSKAAALNFRSAVDAALDTKVTRQLVQRETTIKHEETKNPNSTLGKILADLNQIDLVSVVDSTPEFLLDLQFKQRGHKVDTTLITSDTPRFIPIFNIKAPVLAVDEEVQWLKDKSYERDAFRGNGKVRYKVAIAIVEKVDNFFFVKQDGTVYIDTQALTKIHSYTQALAALKIEATSDFVRSTIDNYLRHFGTLRNQQIMKALKNNKDMGVNSLEAQTPQVQEVTSPTDIATQRTAEEIQALPETLDPENPLRQTLESSLRQAEQDGYITPTRTLQVPEGLRNNKEVADFDTSTEILTSETVNAAAQQDVDVSGSKVNSNTFEEWGFLTTQEVLSKYAPNWKYTAWNANYGDLIINRVENIFKKTEQDLFVTNSQGKWVKPAKSQRKLYSERFRQNLIAAHISGYQIDKWCALFERALIQLDAQSFVIFNGRVPTKEAADATESNLAQQMEQFDIKLLPPLRNPSPANSQDWY